MNTMHEANRRHWNESAAEDFKQRSDETGLWRRSAEDPDRAFDCDLLGVIREFIADLAGKKICIIGSGNNHAAFAFAALGAMVTSVDQSERQLEIAAERAGELGLSLAFVQSDATHLANIKSSEFDLVCSTNGFFVWIADLGALFAEVQRILKPDGLYAFYDIHPFQRPWDESNDVPAVAKPYYDTGPYADSESGPFYFHWMMGDLLNALADAGLSLRRLRECPDKDGSNWQGRWYPDAGLPIWLLAAAQKRSRD